MRMIEKAIEQKYKNTKKKKVEYYFVQKCMNV